jgi:hypothetical protein
VRSGCEKGELETLCEQELEEKIYLHVLQYMQVDLQLQVGNGAFCKISCSCWVTLH